MSLITYWISKSKQAWMTYAKIVVLVLGALFVFGSLVTISDQIEALRRNELNTYSQQQTNTIHNVTSGPVVRYRIKIGTAYHVIDKAAVTLDGCVYEIVVDVKTGNYQLIPTSTGCIPRNVGQEYIKKDSTIQHEFKTPVYR